MISANVTHVCIYNRPRQVCPAGCLILLDEMVSLVNADHLHCMADDAKAVYQAGWGMRMAFPI
jgi:hypothetical protein